MRGRNSIFKDSNDINEKNVVGFFSFLMMVVLALVQIVGSFFNIDITVERFIYDSFLFLTLGTFGISEVSKVTKTKKEDTKVKKFKVEDEDKWQ